MLNSTAIKYQVQTIKAMRNFFAGENFDEIITPPAVENPGMEPHIHPFQLHSVVHNKTVSSYLHTSPEFEIKNVLAHIDDFKNVYNLSYCFRDEPQSDFHRFQFLMLEWYRVQVSYEKIMEDCENLVKFLAHEVPSFTAPESFQKASIKQLFEEILNFNILDFLETSDLKLKIQQDFKDVPLPSSECSWDDYFFLLFLNKIEPELNKYPYLLLYEYPAPLAALSTISNRDSRVCERFEIYMNGIEIANCFNELTNYQEQMNRFDKQRLEKKSLYHYELPEPQQFLSSLERGYPKSAGIALGVERLIMALSNSKDAFYR